METTSIDMFRSTVKYSGEVIFVKPVCDFFQIEYENQCRRINSDPILKTSSGKNPDKLLFGDERERITLTKKGFFRWIQLINPQIVQVSLRKKLIEYQTLIFDFLFGTVEREEEVRTIYHRRDKLKRLKSIITAEIHTCEEKIETYLQGRFHQTKLDFSSPKRTLIT